MKCNVCSEDKELNQFQTYWHSTQQKVRTRKQCNKCYYNLRLKRKNPDMYFQNNPDYHKCNTCKDWKLNNEFYINNKNRIYSHRCRDCTKELERNKRIEYLEQNCGSEKVKTKPNQYVDKYQKECTFNLMQQLGYTFDEPTGIWIKEGWKEIKDGKAFFPKIGKSRIIGQKVTLTMVDEMIRLRKLGYSYYKIAEVMSISDTTIFKYLKKYDTEIN